MEICKECQVCIKCEVYTEKCQTCENCYTCEKVTDNIGIETNNNICRTCENCYDCEKVAQPHGLQEIPVNKKRDIIPNSFTVFASENCNLDCEYCFFRNNKSGRNLTAKVGKDIVDFAFMVSDPKLPLSIWFFGGEPLIAFDAIKKTILYAKKLAKRTGRQFNWGATTNGTLVNKEIFDFWKKQDGNFLISIDGCEEAHDKHRKHYDGTGSYKEIMSWVKDWLKHKQDTSARFTVNPDTLDYQVAGFEALVELGFINIAMCPNQECKWTEDNYKQYKSNLQKIGKIYLENLMEGKKLVIKPFEDGFSLHKLKCRVSGGRCGTAGFDIGVGVDGKLYLCHRFVLRDLKPVGDVYDGFNETRGALHNFPVNKVIGYNCDNCKIKNRCNGGCLAVNYDICGDIYKVPIEVCRQEEIHQEVADEIIEKIKRLTNGIPK